MLIGHFVDRLEKMHVDVDWYEGSPLNNISHDMGTIFWLWTHQFQHTTIEFTLKGFRIFMQCLSGTVQSSVWRDLYYFT